MRLAVAVILLGGFALGAGYVLHDTCSYTPWDDNWQYEHYCYSDVLPLWFGHHLNEGAVPFLDGPKYDDTMEYPVLTAGFMWGAARLAHHTLEPLGVPPLQAYMELSFALLTLAGALSIWAMWHLRPDPARLFAWILSPALLIHGLVNWDFLAVAAALSGWLAWRRDRPFLAALLFGLGGAAKLYPAFFLPFLLVAMLQRRDAPGAGRVVLGGTLGFGVPNLVFAIPAFGPWMDMWRFQANREPDFETPWQSALQPFLRWAFDLVYDAGFWITFASLVGLIVMATALAWLALRVGRGRLDPLVAGTILTMVFLLVNKVYSPQYTLWALPLLLLVEARWTPLLLFVAADTANFLVRYPLLASPPGSDEWDRWSALAVNLRWLFLLWCTWGVVRRHVFVRPMRRAPQKKESQAPGERSATDTRA